MKIIAICPNCQQPISRIWCLNLSLSLSFHLKRICPHCDSKIQTNLFWDWFGSACFAIPAGLPFYLYLEEIISLSTFFVFVIGVINLGVIAFPYITPFELCKTSEINNDEQNE